MQNWEYFWLGSSENINANIWTQKLFSQFFRKLNKFLNQDSGFKMNHFTVEMPNDVQIYWKNSNTPSHIPIQFAALF